MDDDLDSFLYGDDKQAEQGGDVKMDTGTEGDVKQEKDEEEDEDEDDEEDEEDDLEIVLDEGGDGQPSSGAADGKRSAVRLDLNPSAAKEGEEAAPAVKAGGIDINAVGELDGQKIFDVELDGFADKPWRKPGADITDFFNYGFNEETWRSYCMKQRHLRDAFNPNKRIALNPMGLPTGPAAQQQSGSNVPPTRPSVSGPPPVGGHNDYSRPGSRADNRYEYDADRHRDKRRREDSSERRSRADSVDRRRDYRRDDRRRR